MIAIIRTGGKQYKIKEGDKIVIEKIDGKEEDKVSFEEVLLFDDGKEVKVGAPIVEGVKVEGRIIAQKKDVKKKIVRHKAKKRQLTRKGHRQDITEVEITKIS